MEKELQKTNDELDAILVASNTDICVDPVVGAGDNKVQEHDAQIGSSQGPEPVEYVHVDSDSLSITQQYALFQKIDSICFNIYREIGRVDEAFEKVSTNFYNLAEAYGKQAVQSKNRDLRAGGDVAVVSALVIGGLAIQGAGNIHK